MIVRVSLAGLGDSVVKVSHVRASQADQWVDTEQGAA